LAWPASSTPRSVVLLPACGAPLGGYISDNFGWRIAFLCQSPLLLGGMLLIFLKCKEPKSFLASPTSGWDKVKRLVGRAAPPLDSKLIDLPLPAAGSQPYRIDYLGSLTLVGGIGTLLLASELPFAAAA
jgi:MFS family permease